MGCSSCGSGGGTPRGCKNNGTCSSGGCNKLEVYDWLANVALPNGQTPYDIVELRFKNSRKAFYRNTKAFSLQAGDVVVVEASPGFDVGVVSVVGELARIQVGKKEPGFKINEAKKVMRIATQDDIDNWIKARALEKDVMYSSRTLAVNLGLEMKISDVEYQGDLTKAVFYYTAEGRVDFRQLIKDMADAFKIRIEMRQIGARQEASRLGAIGSCGRELCCSTWLTDFRSVSTSAARYQQLSLNPQKLAGQCGKLKCCLNYELDMYLEALKAFPKSDVKIYTEKGTAYHVKTDVFKQQMWFGYSGEAAIGSGLMMLSPDRVKEIIAMNKDGVKPKDLTEFIQKEKVEVVSDYENVVGQDSLNRFEHAFKSKKKKKKPNPNNPNNENRPRPVKQHSNPQNQAKPQGGQPKPANQQRPQQGQPKSQQGNQPKNQQQGTPQPRPQQVNQPQAQQQEGGEQKPKRNNNNRRRNPNRNREDNGSPKGENQ
jgi:cell fate regulator YaaT (PSP1 superfamily)